jgi:Domain of unknown function (DUF1996)
MHDFYGARAVDSDSSVETMRSGGTSCPLSSDTAGYWFPTLVKNGMQVPPAHLFAYYRAPATKDVQVFPVGHAIVAGGDTRTPPMRSRPQLSLSWSCSDSGPFFTQPPNCGRKNVRAHVHFPDCWNGVEDATNDSASMMYSASKGLCPAEHPINLPRLTLHLVFNMKDATGATLSSDGAEPNGTQLHADFLNAWDQGVLQFLVSTCLNQARSCKQLNDVKLADLGYVPPPPPPPPVDPQEA